MAAQLGNKRLAVLEFRGKNLEQDILMTFSDTVRGGALQGLSGRGVVVMTRENMLVLLKDMGKKDCQEGECEVETARNIGADYVVSGKVVRMEKNLRRHAQAARNPRRQLARYKHCGGCQPDRTHAHAARAGAATDTTRVQRFKIATG